MKIRLVGAELFHVDRRTDGQDVAFCNFANAPKMTVNGIPNILYIGHMFILIKIQCNLIKFSTIFFL
jgi:hypothetical protein